MRAPFNVAVLAYRQTKSELEFLVLKRSDNQYWQVIAGGGEDNESPIAAARRESKEEAQIPENLDFFKLDTLITVPATEFSDHAFWPKETYVIPQYYFAVDAGGHAIEISSEHTDYKWCLYNEARATLKFESDQIAIYELNARLLVRD